MSGIHVLSDILKGGSAVEKTVNPEGKDSSDSPGNVAEVFASMLSGLMNSKGDSKGQNFKASLESDETQSADKPVPSIQNQNELGSMLGYGQFVLTNYFKPTLPAGKEANSGNDVSQGIGGLATANALLTKVPNISGNNFELAMLKDSSLVSDEVFTSTGMTTPNPQGANPVRMELDQYRQVIADLLVALSGKITDLSPEGTPLVLEPGTSERQGIMKIIQNWLTVTVTEDVLNNGLGAPSAQSIVSQSTSGQENVSQGTSGQGNVGQDNNGQGIVVQGSHGRTVGNLEEYIPLPQGDFETVVDQAHSKNLNYISSNTGVEDLRQVIARIVQGLILGTDKAAVDQPSSSIQTSMPYSISLVNERVQQTLNIEASVGKSIVNETELGILLQPGVEKVIKRVLDFLATELSTGNRELNTKALPLGVILNQILNQIHERNIPQEVIKEMLPTKNDRLDTLLSWPKSSSQVSETAVTPGKDVLFQSDLKPKLAGVDIGNSNPLKNIQGISNEESSKGALVEASGVSSVKVTQDQNLSLGIGAVGNITTGNVADGKTVAIPVYEQISNVFRQQVTSRNQELKELEIKLHPADLGRIQIGLRWENGQVHLIVHASEPATGQMLQNQLLELRHTLTNQGVNCGTLQMGQQGGDQQQNRQGNESRGTLEATPSLSEDEEASLGFNAFSPGQDGNNRINVTA